MFKRKKKNAVVPCTDANQHARESLERKKREREIFLKKLAEYKAKEEEARKKAAEEATDKTPTE